MMIDPATGWFEIVEIPTLDIDEDITGNDEYTGKSSARVSQLFNDTWFFRYPCSLKLCLITYLNLKRDFTPFLKDFDINLF